MAKRMSISMLIEFFILSIFISIFMPLTIGYFVLIDETPITFLNGSQFYGEYGNLTATFGLIAPSIVITLFKNVLPILFPIIIIVSFIGYLYTTKD